MVKIKVAVCQCACQEFDFEKTLSHLEKYSREASLKGAELALFPEGFIGGYPRYSHFGSLIGCRSDEGREEFARYYEGSISIFNENEKSSEIQRIENISKNENIYLVIGIIEKDGGTLYCSVIYIHPLKGFVHSRRKLMPTGIERLIWGFGQIKDVKPIQFNKDISMSAVICWENYMPLLRYYIYSQNIQIYLAPTADGRDTWISTMQHIAIEGRTFVLSANQFVKTKNMPKYHPLPQQYSDPESILTNGGSVIIDPFGKILAGPLYHTEGIITADIDIDQCIKGKMDFDVCGHYSRNDSFKLIINNSFY
jgi:beta-cyano-L-alanine hydratase/nitrilase